MAARMVREWPTEPLVYGSDRTGKREKLGSKGSTCSSARSLEDRVRGTLNALEIRVRRERLQYVKSQLEKNRENFQHQLGELERLSQGRDKNHQASEVESDGDDGTIPGKSGTPVILSRLGPFRENSRQPYAKVKSRKPQIYSKINAENVNARKIVFTDVSKLEAIGRLPSYTAWMFVDRNERMTEDQSIARRRRISYESNGKETFYCLNAEEEAEAADGGEERRDIRGWSTSEEFITRMVILEHGSGHRVLETIANFLQVSVAKVESRVQSFSTEVYADTNSSLQPAGINSASRVFRRRSIYNGFRYQHLFEKLREDDEQDSPKMVPRRTDAKVVPSIEEAEEETKTSTTLELALDSFDTLFCRRCLVFNCALHDCLEEVVVGVNEIQPPCASAERDQTKPCSPGCRFLVSSFSRPPEAPSSPVVCSSGSAFQLSSSRVSMATQICENIYVRDGGGIWEDHRLEKRMATHPEHVRELRDDDREEVENECDLSSNIGESLVLETARGIVHSREKKKRLSILGEGPLNRKNAKKGSERSLNEAVPMERMVDDAESSSDSMAYKYERKHHRPNGNVVTSSRTISCTERDQKRAKSSKRFCSSNIVQGTEIEPPPTEPANKWNRLEQDLCEKGLQIFGRNSCLIAQNVLKGCKSCQEISEYIRELDNGAAVNAEETSNAHVSLETGTTLRSVQYLNTGRGFRPKLRFGRKKVAPKYALGGIRKRIGRDGGILNLCRQYTPCRCESIIGCGKDCPCVLMNMHCEKYCGCFKVCKNRFRGCQCAKSMCDRRHCPCFAAGRECDPDLCKFCGIECGHSSSQECHNMRILQRKKKRLLLAHSDVCTGWGVFTRHPLHKNDYIGEYTGELISHSEADRRGRIYDRETSFLFNLNDKLVVDAFRKGNKLKFANHSASKANCYAKVLLVGGDHRVGIFAKDKIEAGEELLYDYQYEPEIAPLWATGPD